MHTGLSPDGKLVVWEMREIAPDATSGPLRIFLADSRKPLTIDNLKRRFRGDSHPPVVRPMTRIDEDATDPSFAPDGKSIAFRSRRGADAFTQVWSLSLSGGEAEPITAAESNVLEYEWGSDGSLAFLTEEPRTIRIDDGTGEPRVLFEAKDEARTSVSDLAFAHNANSLAFRMRETAQPLDSTSMDGEDTTDIYLLDRGSGEVQRLTNRPGSETWITWSFDDAEIYFLASPDAAASPFAAELANASPLAVHRVPRGGGEVSPVTKRLALPVLELQSCVDSDRLFAIVADGENRRVARLRPREGSHEILFQRNGRLSSLSTTHDAEKLYFAYESPGAGPELASWTFPDEDLVVLTFLNRKPDAP